MRSHYSQDDIISVLKGLGVKKGDTIFSHVSLLSLGFLQSGNTPRRVTEIFREALEQVIGIDGCFITPSYSYSFCKGDHFDPRSTPSDCGPFANQLLSMEDVLRSNDPLFSVVGFGNLGSLFDNIPNSSFGDDCLYERLLERNAKIVNIGASLYYFTPVHYLERKLGVPYRYDKIFNGVMQIDDKRHIIDWVYYVRDLDKLSMPDCSELQRVGIERGIVKESNLGIGKVVTTSLRDYFALAKECVSVDPWFLTVNAEWSRD